MPYVEDEYFAVKFMSDDPLQIGWSSDFETVGEADSRLLSERRQKNENVNAFTSAANTGSQITRIPPR
jgi:hypothetical protein